MGRIDEPVGGEIEGDRLETLLDGDGRRLPCEVGPRGNGLVTTHKPEVGSHQPSAS